MAGELRFKPTREEIYAVKHLAAICIQARSAAVARAGPFGLAISTLPIGAAMYASQAAFLMAQRIAARNQERTK